MNKNEPLFQCEILHVTFYRMQTYYMTKHFVLEKYVILDVWDGKYILLDQNQT